MSQLATLYTVDPSFVWWLFVLQLANGSSIEEYDLLLNWNHIYIYIYIYIYIHIWSQFRRRSYSSMIEPLANCDTNNCHTKEGSTVYSVSNCDTNNRHTKEGSTVYEEALVGLSNK